MIKDDLYDRILDERKVAFIICVNDEMKYNECRYYLSRLCVPDGYSMDIISIQEAPSMTAGYNAAMKSSDAKYKIYLHQDVYIKNAHFLADILEVFVCDQRIGMLGMVGKKEMGTTAFDMMEWDVGRVIYDYEIMNYTNEGRFMEAALLDGLLLATQYDIPWREDIFDGWDFYDASQCMEFRKSGYKVAVPYQKEIWCCHDGLCSDLTAYFDYYECFIHEYAGVMGVSPERSKEELLACEKNKNYVNDIDRLSECLGKLMDLGRKEELRDFFENSNLAENASLREYKAIVFIDLLEERNQSLMRFWNSGMSASQLILKLRILKCMLKRIEYDVSDLEKDQIGNGYSRYAIQEICDRHTIYKDKIYEKLKKYLAE